MSLHSPIKLFVGGCGMITSCSVWLFEPSKNPPVAAMTLNDSSSPGSIKLDTLTPVDKLSNWQGEAIKDSNVEVVNPQINSSITLKFKDKSKQDAILNVMDIKIEKFYVYGNSTKEKYQDFDRKQIKIKLFKKAAWYSDSREEEYEEALDETKLSELFGDLEEVRVKQLLLALNHRVEWKSFGSSSENRYYMNRVFANELDELKDLKIRHFKDFNKLKEYVRKKVETCVDDTTACYPHVDEIDYMEVDKREYFEDAWKK